MGPILASGPAALPTANRDEAALTLGYIIGAGLEVVPWLLRTFAAKFPQRQLRTVEYDFSDPCGSPPCTRRSPVRAGGAPGDQGS